MGRLLLDDDARVCAWLDEQMGLKPPPLVKTAIGYERNGEIVSAVVFDNLTDNNVFAHVASRAVMFPVELACAVVRFVYVQLGLERMTFVVAADNAPCLRFVEKTGAELEARLVRGTKRADVLMFVLWRDTGLPARLAAAGRI